MCIFHLSHMCETSTAGVANAGRAHVPTSVPHRTKILSGTFHYGRAVRTNKPFCGKRGPKTMGEWIHFVGFVLENQWLNFLRKKKSFRNTNKDSSVNLVQPLTFLNCIHCETESKLVHFTWRKPPVSWFSSVSLDECWNGILQQPASVYFHNFTYISHTFRSDGISCTPNC
jgi:hypothetical protein